MRAHETTITVRFNEVDAYRVAWHGHYVAWMEIGRNNLSGQFGLGPDDLLALAARAPVVSLELKYLRPALLMMLLRFVPGWRMMQRPCCVSAVRCCLQTGSGWPAAWSAMP